MADLDELLPEKASEQDQRLMADLRRMYGVEAQTAEHLARARQRLLAQSDETMREQQDIQEQHTPLTGRQGRVTGGMREQTRSSAAGARSWQRGLSTLAAVLVVGVLVGSLLLVLSRTHRSGLNAPGNAPNSSKLAGGSGNLLSIHMIDATTGWALSDHEALRTTDGGLHWNNVTPPGASITKDSLASFLSASQVWIATPRANTTTTQIARTTDSGQTWQQSTIPMGYLRQMTFIDAQHGWILAAWDSGGGAAEAVAVYRTLDGGKTWSNVSNALAASTDGPPPGHLPYGGSKTGIQFLNASTGWITGMAVGNEMGLFYVTHDGGATWYPQSLPRSTGVPSAQLSLGSPTFFSVTDGVLPVIFTNADTGKGFATGIYVTHDGGQTWASATVLPFAAVATAFVDAQHGWTTDGASLYRTGNAAQAWTKLAPGANFKQITSLSFVSTTLGWAISGQGAGSSSLLKTTDGGQTWTPVPLAIS